SGTTGEVTVFSSANDFATILVEIKKALSVEARDLRAEVDRFKSLLAENASRTSDAEARLAAAKVNAPGEVADAEGAIAKLQADRASIETQIADLSAKAAAFEQRFNAASAAEK